MAAHKTNSLLKYVLPLLLVLVLLAAIRHCSHQTTTDSHIKESSSIKNAAANDSAAESLNTLTAELAQTQQQIQQVASANESLKQQNAVLAQQAQGKQSAALSILNQQLNDLKAQLAHPTNGTANSEALPDANGATAITTVADVADQQDPQKPFSWLTTSKNKLSPSTTPISTPSQEQPKPIPYYTIPANATAVNDRLMSALVGRIPVKGVVTDPYPFKIVFSDDTLAANGLRVPHLQQMVVSGYSEGDLNLVSVRGWVTSLTFVFEDGTISTTSSNNDDIGHFSKENALGYLSDPQGNPFLRGKLISNAPTYLGVNVALGAAQGAANAYAQAQTTNQSNLLGGNSSAVTGSPGAFVAGQAASNAANQVQQWWHDRQENSFDAVYVPAGQAIVVNFAKAIAIDYNPLGRKLDYAKNRLLSVNRRLD